MVKRYHNHTAVDHVTMDIPKGSIYGLLGPNGAGKTSLIRIITRITIADEGEILFDGETIKDRHQHDIGYMPEERGLYKKMKVGDHLVYLARLKGFSKKNAMNSIKHWMDRFEISDWWDKKIEELSKGMQQKIQFIATVLHKPKLLILDEPFSGLDPINTNLIKDEIRLLNQQGTSVIFSTHRMEQVEEICEYISLISEGRVILEGKVTDIKSLYKENIYNVMYKGVLPELNGNFEYSNENGKLICKLKENTDPNKLLSFLLDKGVEIHAFNEILPSINDIFIKTVERAKNTNHE